MSIIAKAQFGRDLESREIQKNIDLRGCLNGTFPEFVVN
jgi:hypothetical protein